MTKEIVPVQTAGQAKAAGPVRAQPLTAYKVFWLFLIAGVAGDLIEVVFWLFTRGELISRSSLLYGPFSLVWALGAVLLTVVFHRMEDQRTAKVFLWGTVLGGVYEYVCSWVQEIAFGVCFWDYRHLPFNLNGRINLVFCLFWGAAAVVWVRAVYPALCAFIVRIPRQAGLRMARAAAAFLLCSAVLSGAALLRMEQRREGVPASGAFTQFLDERFPDVLLQARYPNMGYLD